MVPDDNIVVLQRIQKLLPWLSSKLCPKKKNMVKPWTDVSYQARPDAVLVYASNKYEEPKSGDKEAEKGHKHDPALRISWVHMGGGQQGPHQSTKHLEQTNTQ